MWCTYGYTNKHIPDGIAKVRSKNKGAVNLEHVPEQHYDDWWDINYIMFHDSKEEAINFLNKKINEN